MGRAPGALGIVAAAALAACGAAHTPKPAPTAPLVTPSSGSAGGAVTGFLRAAAAQDEGKVLSWLATPSDTTDLNELLKVYADFGTSGGFFWDVAGVTVTGVRTVDATHADVALSAPIGWCLGQAPDDPAATCSQVDGVSAMPDTYVAVLTGGRWAVDIDVNASRGLDHNPQASATAGASTTNPPPTVTPAPT